MIDDKYILDNFYKKNGAVNIQAINKNEEVKRYLLERYVGCTDLKEIGYRLKFHIDIVPYCPTCGKELKFNGKYNTYCSNSCQRKNPDNIKKYKETCISKYGVDNPAKCKSIIDKAKKTCISKYGGTSPMHNNIVKEKFNLQKINDKRNHTKRNNNSFNTSLKEEKSYLLLLSKYPDTLRQYTSNEYPFNCDFYIPSLNLYIECNYHWTHGEHPYNEMNINDTNKLIIWRHKSIMSNFYKNAIETWTVRDINKRNIAKNNNLNYIEFWNINELELWIKN